MAKRRLISLLPGFNQTDDLTNFFGSTVDEMFQPGTSEPISGFIGRVPTFSNPVSDFYVGEPTPSRAAYQLEAGMISATNSSITNALSYPDFVGYLLTEGANVSDHQRMFETEYYSWAPPINIDMLVNYRNYYWFGDLSGPADLPILTLSIPINQFVGDGVTTTYALPGHINSVSLGDETPAVYVGGVAVSFTIAGDNAVLSVAPAVDAIILTCRTPDYSQLITGSQLSIDISDLNTENVLLLTSTMRVRIIDAFHIIGAWDAAPWDYTLWDLSGDNIYMVDGVGEGVRLTPYNNLITGLEAQYVTIDRSSLDSNLWSAHNSWVHKDSYAWSHDSFPERQAVRPIIEFIRDIVLYPHQTWTESADPLFILYDIDNVALNDPGRYPNSNFVGNRIFGYAAGSTPEDVILHRQLAFDTNGYPLFNNDAFSIQYTWSNSTDTFPITSLYCYSIYLPTIWDLLQWDQGQWDSTNLNALAVGYQSLWHPAPAVTAQNEIDGFFEVPLNLEANPLSDDVTLISRSTWIDHFSSIIASQIGLIGHALGDNNYRDTARDLSFGIFILQHRAPLLKAMLTASEGDFDLPQGIRYADNEYNRFRNKFVRRLVILYNNGTLGSIDPIVDPLSWVVKALNDIKRDKTTNFPFALNMIGGAQYFIPPTPTALGVLPAAVPVMLTDEGIPMIQGHDGSLTPAFGDWRDNVLLRLEQLIYDNLPSQFQTEARPVFDIQQWIGGRFFAPFNGYNRNEFTDILGPMFEIWAQQNQLNYRKRDDYDPGDPFTWNFHGVADIFGNLLPGNWRAIYRWYYGTSAPHSRPWEMLGFLSEPSWWVINYGSAPYVRSNPMWTDLENGVVLSGPRAGIDLNYARPGLANLIPVDAAGNLLDPVSCGIVTQSIPLSVGNRTWQAGDHGPVENLWINSPAYRYAVALAAFLMKPARVMEECWDSLNIGYVGTQWVELDSLARPLNVNQYVHGEAKPDGTTAVVTGVQQWIVDNLIAAGKTLTNFGQAVRGLDVRLLHQMAGFVSSDDIKTVADNFGLLPSEDVSVVLYTSPSTDVEVYSGVILEWTGSAWRVIGYDARDPFFTIIPPDLNGPKGIISLATAKEPSIVQWHPNTYYPSDILAEYQHSVYQCIRNHTSGPNFELDFWKTRADLSTAMIRAPRVITYLRGLPKTQDIAYGTEFTTYQDVADFLLGWQRWLVNRGWIFDAVDPNTGIVLDWALSVREFLTWAQVQWQPGNFIAMSPGMRGLHFATPTGTILNVEDNITGFFGLIDRSGAPIKESDVIITRLDGEINLLANTSDIFSCRLEIASIEHTLVFSNVTIFDDDIYLPLFDMRQSRLRLICRRSTQWAGRLDAPGFVVIGNQLKSNFEKSANDVRLMFDIEQADVKKLRDYARHVVGFQERDYLNNLLLSDVSQFEFYQGMIQQKGAPGVFQKLMRSTLASDQSNLQFLEEWAVRLGRFGAPIDPLVTFRLAQIDTRDDPQIVRFSAMSNAPLDWIIMPLSDDRWVDMPAAAQFFTMEPSYLPPSYPTAGPVRLDDIDATLFHIADLGVLYDTQQDNNLVPFATGTKTWVYERADGTYTVLESFETGSVPNQILMTVSNAEDVSVTTMRIFFQNTMNMTSTDVGSFLVIDGNAKSQPEIRGVQTITAVGSDYVEIDVVGTLGFDFTTTLTEAPFVRILREMRFETLVALASASYSFITNDLAWIDNYASTGRWAVMQWNGTAWILIRNQPLRINPSTISETVIYYENVRITGQRMIANEPVVDVIDVIDPVAGIVTGIAAREIDYATEYDPARYNNGAADVAANPWGQDQVGRVWWNLSTIKFLDPYTDITGASSARDLDELTYRTSAWTHIAPNTSVDVYQWIKSVVDPISYAGDPTNNPGTVYNAAGNNADGPTESWVEETKPDPITGVVTTFFYFWVSGLTTTPELPFRNIDVATVATAIANPSGLDIAWMAPINNDTLIVSGVLQFLNDVDTVMKVRLTIDPENPSRHDEWLLMRETDETSLPPDMIWNKLRDSLTGYNQAQKILPYPILAPTRGTGIGIQQNMFMVNGTGGNRSGLMDAREIFVTSVNNILAETAITIDRFTYISTISRTTPINQYLTWTQVDHSYPFEQPPSNEWDIQEFSLDRRNQLVARTNFLNAVTSGTTIRVLLNGIGNPLPTQSWSIWNFNPVKAAAVIAAHPLLTPEAAMLQNVDQVFDLAQSYEWMVADTDARNALVTPLPTISVGDRVLVNSDVFGFWAIWKYLPSSPDADAFGYILWRVQNYNTNDFFSYVDWYADGYSVTNPPIITYATVADRTATEGSSPINLFVKIEDDGTPSHSWIWTAYDTSINVWRTVAIQNGTIALSKNFYDPTRLIHGFNSISVSDIGNRDGSWELYILVQALRFGGLLLDIEINHIFFDIINFCHAQQSDVDWAFKTSFMTIVGYNVPLQETPFVVPDQTDNLISYVNEVKPYHVKIREFSTQYNTDIDIGNTTVTDFDKPVYLDPVTGLYRVLDPLNDTDILQTKPWLYWYDNYNAAVSGAEPNKVRGLDITLLFDRYAADFDAWDTTAWDSDPWDSNESLMNMVYVHSTITNTLSVPSLTVDVDDVRFMEYNYDVNGNQVAIGVTNPLIVNIGSNSYLVSTVTMDDVNVSTAMHGDSGTLTLATYVTTASASTGAFVLTLGNTNGIHVGQRISGVNIPSNTTVSSMTATTVTLSAAITASIGIGASISVYVSVSDGTADNLVEALIAMPSAAARIINSYEPTGDMTPNVLPLLLDLDMGAGYVTYITTLDVAAGGTVLTFASTAGVSKKQPVVGPNIIKGTLSSVVTATTITLAAPTIGVIPAGTAIRFALPNWINGFVLQTFNAPVSEFDLFGYDDEDFDIVTDIYDTNYSGGTPGRVITVDINPYQTSRKGFGLIAPYYTEGHPQERIPFAADDGLQLIVTADADAGGPPQVIKVHDVSALAGPTAILFYDLISQSRNGIMVFKDGVRVAFGTDYTVDHLGRLVDILDITSTNLINIHAFGFGGTSASKEQHFISFSSNPIALNANNVTSDVAVVANGIPLNGSQYSVSGSNVTITSGVSPGNDVAVVTFDGGVTTETVMTTQNLAYNISQQWTLNPHDTDTIPEHAGTIVEVNGLRLTPPLTYYGKFDVLNEYMFIPNPPLLSTTVTVYVDGVLYAHAIPFGTGTSPSSSYPLNVVVPSPPSTMIAGQFVFFDNTMIALDSTFVSDNVVVILDFVGSPPDYTVVGGVLTINTVLGGSDAIVATTFSNSESMGLETVVYEVGDPVYVVPTPFAKDYALVAMNGLALAPDYDYEIVSQDIGWDSLPFDSNVFDLSIEGLSVLDIFTPTSGDIVATITTAQAARETMQWRVSTNTPAFLRMPEHFDEHGNRVHGIPVHGSIPFPVVLHDVEFEYIRQSPYMAGSLIDPLAPTDSSMVVSLFLQEISTKLMEDYPLPAPTPVSPGVVWIGGERIEYFRLDRSFGGIVTLSGLRRGTRGTTIAEQRVVASTTGTGSSQTLTLDTTNGLGPIELVIDDMLSSAFTASFNLNSVDVTFTAAVGSFVTIAMTNSFDYPAGTSVYNGIETFSAAVPVGIPVGNREIKPMQDIITR